MSWKDLFPKQNRYFETENGILYRGDSFEIVDMFPEEAIDLVVTSPPYNVGMSYDSYEDRLKYDEYIDWLTLLFTNMYGKIVDGGRICINIGDAKNGKIPTHSDIIQRLSKIYLLSAVIVWNKRQIGNRLSWGSFKSPSCVSYPTPFEYILLFCKGSYRLKKKGKSDLTKEEFTSWAYALWEFPPETGMRKIGHPAVFPQGLPKRCIKLNSYVGDLILDPFAGAGTTLMVAEKLGRRWVGIELSDRYCEIAKERIKSVTDRLF